MVLPKEHKYAIRLFEFKNTTELVEEMFDFDPQGRFRAENLYARIGFVQLCIENGIKVTPVNIATCIEYVDCLFGDYKYLSDHPEYKNGLIESKIQLQIILNKYLQKMIKRLRDAPK